MFLQAEIPKAVEKIAVRKNTESSDNEEQFTEEIEIHGAKMAEKIAELENLVFDLNARNLSLSKRNNQLEAENKMVSILNSNKLIKNTEIF